MNEDGMNAKAFFEWFKSVSPYATTILLSVWGGAANYLSSVRSGKTKFCTKNFCADLFISSFAGLLTHFLCDSSDITGASAAMLIAVSGHMGTRAIRSFESFFRRVFGANENEQV